MLPVIMAQYRLDRFEAFVTTEEGVGLRMTPSASVPLNVAAGINMGSGRDHDTTDLLEGMPDLDNPLQIFGTVKLFCFSATFRYFPITADYDGQPDQEYDGMVVDVDWERGWWLREFVMLNLGLGFTWMNSDYADAHYSVIAPTARLDEYQAEQGIHDVHSSVGAILIFSERVGMGIMTELSYLTGDAGDSPLTDEAFQVFGGASVFYHF